jgi:uncharacterized spore protein YtfJ
MAENGMDGVKDGAERSKGKAFRAAEAAGEGGLAGIMASLAERVGAHSGATAVFGDPVESDGRTIIPVAQSMWGSGAGSGTSDAEGTGSGAGGGAVSRPLGYIDLSAHGATYVPLQRPWQDAKLILAWAVAVWLVARAVRGILRG